MGYDPYWQPCSSIEASLNQDLSNINRWLIASTLTLNMTKTEFMLIGSRQKLNSLAILPALDINHWWKFNME